MRINRKHIKKNEGRNLTKDKVWSSTVILFVLQSGVTNSMCRLSQLTVLLSLMVIKRGKQKHMPVCVTGGGDKKDQ
jgi:hypothetical protein